MHTLAQKAPQWAKKPAKRLLQFARGIQYRGDQRFCPVCQQTSSQFAPSRRGARPDALCVRCGALERHRLAWLYITKQTNLFDGKPKKMLHIAPEACFEPRLRQHLGDDYLTADLFNRRAMIKMDITNIQYPDNSFDVIYCSHVLEHVLDDRKAMREFHRTLKADGWAILLVPITDEVTFEDPTIVDPAERLRVFGQEDHVRRYGHDYVDRLREAGFHVKKITSHDLAPPDEIQRMGLTPAAGEIYYCTKSP